MLTKDGIEYESGPLYLPWLAPDFSEFQINEITPNPRTVFGQSDIGNCYASKHAAGTALLQQLKVADMSIRRTGSDITVWMIRNQ